MQHTGVRSNLKEIFTSWAYKGPEKMTLTFEFFCLFEKINKLKNLILHHEKHYSYSMTLHLCGGDDIRPLPKDQGARLAFVLVHRYVIVSRHSSHLLFTLFIVPVKFRRIRVTSFVSY